MTQALKGSQWDVFNAIRMRRNSNGLAVMPVAGPYPQTAQVVAMHGGLEEDIVVYEVQRKGEPPLVPAPYTTNPNRVYMAGEQTAPFPIPELSGVKTYAVRGWVLWAILAPEGLESDFMLGSLPFPGLDSDERIPAEYLTYQLVNQRVVRTLGNATVPTEPDAIKAILRYQLRNGN